MQPHLGVHRRREQHRTPRRQQRRGQQIVGSTGRRAGQQVGGGRRHYDQIGLLAEVNMRDRRNVGENVGAHRLTGERLEGRGTDEAQGGFGGNDSDAMTGLGELTNNRARLVGGDAPETPTITCLGIRLWSTTSGLPCYSPSVCSSRSAWISRNAMDNGFSCNPGSTSGPTYSRMPSPSWL